MKHKLLEDLEPARRFVVACDTDDEVVVSLRAWAQQLGIRSASFSGTGAFRAVTFGYFDPGVRDYVRIELEEQVEVLSLEGTIALADNLPVVHAHVVVATRDGRARGGRLLSAYVRPTLELIVIESSVTLQRIVDPVSGLPLLDLDR